MRKLVAPEIEISLTFNIPDHYKNKGRIIWTKKWRREGLYEEKIVDSAGKSYEKGKGKELAWLRKLRYFYVPAVRDERYFVGLMSTIYDALNEVSAESLRKSSLNLAVNIKELVNNLVSEISSKLSFNSTVTTPSDFRLLFSTLDFVLENAGNKISLMKHGDGIKALHIPIILKFVAQILHKQKGKQINTDVIWGFEEPENNLEIGKAFSLAEIFREYSKDIQIFVNTHSPAFYLLGENGQQTSQLFWVEKDDSGKTVYVPKDCDSIKSIDSKIGFMPIISRYIEEQVKKDNEERRVLENMLEEIKKISIRL